MSDRFLYFIQHSSYLYVGEECMLLFDYYGVGDVLSLIEKFEDKHLYIFCTHSHGDHYNPVVFTAFEGHSSGVSYVFHQELWGSVPEQHRGEVKFVETGETLSIDALTIKAYGSTDEGGSFYINEGGFRLFHAGDLNHWHWNEEASPEYIKLYEEQWRREMNKIVADKVKLDLLMFPTDLRLGKDFLKGLKEFMEEIPTGILAPMHLNGVLEDYSELEEVCATYCARLIQPQSMMERRL